MKIKCITNQRKREIKQNQVKTNQLKILEMKVLSEIKKGSR